MRELGYEAIDGTPGTSASLTLSAVTNNPRISQVTETGRPVHYTIALSNGQQRCHGIGVSTGDGTFTRIVETSVFDGTAYTINPSGFADLPSNCVIYCSAGASDILHTPAPPCAIGEHCWFAPGGPGTVVSSASWSPGQANRDHFWRDRIAVSFPIDRVGLHAAAACNVDFGIYDINWDTGKPGKLLLGWQNKAMIGGMNSFDLTDANLGILNKTPQRMALGDIFVMCNWSATAGAPGRVIDATASSQGSLIADLAYPQQMLYTNRTQGTAFGDNPTITARNITAYAKIPLLAFRGA